MTYTELEIYILATVLLSSTFSLNLIYKYWRVLPFYIIFLETIAAILVSPFILPTLYIYNDVEARAKVLKKEEAEAIIVSEELRNLMREEIRKEIKKDPEMVNTFKMLSEEEASEALENSFQDVTVDKEAIEEMKQIAKNPYKRKDPMDVIRSDINKELVRTIEGSNSPIMIVVMVFLTLVGLAIYYLGWWALLLLIMLSIGASLS